MENTVYRSSGIIWNRALDPSLIVHLHQLRAKIPAGFGFDVVGHDDAVIETLWLKWYVSFSENQRGTVSGRIYPSY